jgi:hypothetical protein
MVGLSWQYRLAQLVFVHQSSVVAGSLSRRHRRYEHFAGIAVLNTTLLSGWSAVCSLLPRYEI